MIQVLKGDRIMEVLFMSERGRPWRHLANQEIQPCKTQANFDLFIARFKRLNHVIYNLP